ncbi:hypothetical protein FACS1894199_18490 [Bacteroidia bacterium]|nr:hypothetical protein FACS1894199_18490 [Bacteroidia bacterium]
MYKLIIENAVLKDLRKIPAKYLIKIKSAINNLILLPRPFGYTKIEGSENKYRIRVGDYRIIYTIEDDILTVEVVKVDHRSSVYK